MHTVQMIISLYTVLPFLRIYWTKQNGLNMSVTLAIYSMSSSSRKRVLDMRCCLINNYNSYDFSFLVVYSSTQ